MESTEEGRIGIEEADDALATTIRPRQSIALSTVVLKSGFFDKPLMFVFVLIAAFYVLLQYIFIRRSHRKKYTDEGRIEIEEADGALAITIRPKRSMYVAMSFAPVVFAGAPVVLFILGIAAIATLFVHILISIVLALLFLFCLVSTKKDLSKYRINKDLNEELVLNDRQIEFRAILSGKTWDERCFSLHVDDVNEVCPRYALFDVPTTLTRNEYLGMIEFKTASGNKRFGALLTNTQVDTLVEKIESYLENKG